MGRLAGGEVVGSAPAYGSAPAGETLNPAQPGFPHLLSGSVSFMSPV